MWLDGGGAAGASLWTLSEILCSPATHNMHLSDMLVILRCAIHRFIRLTGLQK